nr:MAG TPA: hypothetical protein [Bacteriophage sp.]
MILFIRTSYFSKLSRKHNCILYNRKYIYKS